MSVKKLWGTYSSKHDILWWIFIGSWWWIMLFYATMFLAFFALVKKAITLLIRFVQLKIKSKSIENKTSADNTQHSDDSQLTTLSGIEFENICQDLLEKMGFSTERTKATGDGGIDIIAYNDQALISGKYIIQCKRYAGSVGEPIIRDLYGVITSERANKGILMTTGHFTKHAISFAQGKPLELIDGAKMQELIEKYKQSDNRS